MDPRSERSERFEALTSAARPLKSDSILDGLRRLATSIDVDSIDAARMCALFSVLDDRLSDVGELPSDWGQR